MKKDSIIVTLLIIVIVASFSTTGYLIYRNSFATEETPVETEKPLSEREKVNTLITLNNTTRVQRLTDAQRINILKTLHTK